MIVMMISLLIGIQPPGDAISQEVARLKGAWSIISSQTDGKDYTATLKGYSYVFDGQLMKFMDRNGKPVPRSDSKPDERPFLINVLTNPKTIDMTVYAKTKSFLSLGIYQLQNDELMLCLAEPGAPRPTEFKSKAGVTLVVLRRVKQ